jgi:hypothetical protein
MSTISVILIIIDRTPKLLCCVNGFHSFGAVSAYEITASLDLGVVAYPAQTCVILLLTALFFFFLTLIYGRYCSELPVPNGCGTLRRLRPIDHTLLHLLL